MNLQDQTCHNLKVLFLGRREFCRQAKGSYNNFRICLDKMYKGEPCGICVAPAVKLFWVPGRADCIHVSCDSFEVGWRLTTTSKDSSIEAVQYDYSRFIPISSSADSG